MSLENWFLQYRLDETQREIVEEMLAQRDERISELVAEINELVES